MHSPLPWRAQELTRHFCIVDAAGTRVADVRYVMRPDSSTSRDEAEFICRAVNAQEALIAALKHLLEEIAADPHLGEFVTATHQQQAYAAIALAEGR